MSGFEGAEERKRAGDVAEPGLLGVVDPSATTIDGVAVGRFTGYLATWEEDEGGKFGVPDQFARGAFAKSLAEHRARGNRPIRLRFMHDALVGKFPIEDAVEDERGLKVAGEINLSTALGRDAWALVKQGALSDLSIGFFAVRDRFVDGGRKRLIEEAIIREGSLVDEPANRGARILRLKGGDATLGGILEELREMADDLRERKPREASDPPPESKAAAAILEELRGTADDLRRKRRESISPAGGFDPWSQSSQSASLRAIARDLEAARADLRRLRAA